MRLFLNLFFSLGGWVCSQVVGRHQLAVGDLMETSSTILLLTSSNRRWSINILPSQASVTLFHQHSPHKLIWEGIGCICRFHKCVLIVRVILGWWSFSLEMIATVQSTLASQVQNILPTDWFLHFRLTFEESLFWNQSRTLSSPHKCHQRCHHTVMCVLQEVKYYPHERCRGGLVIKISSACVPWGTKCCDAAYNYRVVSPSTSARSGFTWNCDIGGGEDQDGSGNPPHHLHNLLPSPLFPPRDPPLWALWALAACSQHPVGYF